MNRKIGAKDLITLGIFTVIYFVIGAALSLLVSIPIMVPFFPAVWALINGTVFMLYTTKVEKFGLVTLMGVLTGLLVGLTGMGFWCVPTGLVFGLLGDFIMKKGNYKSFKHNLIGYAIFSIWTSGSLIPWYFFAQDTLAKYTQGWIQRGLRYTGTGLYSMVELAVFCWTQFYLWSAWSINW